ncbi:unnamed protein product [Rhizophagus irregularis]|nr:unnamed protein product [Rhizophagus irregularis]CAB5384783.1 unnamed protein product [Rhizophagus irregularis]
MDPQKYNGNIHPDEWISDLQTYFNIKQNLQDFININAVNINIVISLVDSTIKLPTGIDNIEKLRNALKEDITFTVFKNTNKRKLQSLKYNPERKGGDTSNFISTFRKLCYNAEINDIEEQKKILYKSLPNNHFNYVSNEFFEKMKNKWIYCSFKHVATGKYLSSIKNLCYTTGSRKQLVFVGSSEHIPNSLWKIEFGDELATYANNSIKLQHVLSHKFLGIYYYYYDNTNRYYISEYSKSPSTNYTEVSCYNNTDHDYGYWNGDWMFNHSKLENHQGFLKSNDIINLNIKKIYANNEVEFLRSHDIQFTIGNDVFQEVVCHNERLGGNDEWCIELIHEVKIF